MGEGQDPDGSMGFLNFEEIDGKERPYMLFFKHACVDEKV